ncbi:hypothetical protein CN918_30855 [Priestia megaterium]|nr:hypothetical protein CN918_30855 [Priestia megaterium]
MKRSLISTLILLLVITLLGACSKTAPKEEHTYTIEEVNVKITDDTDLLDEIGVTDSENRWITVHPKALYYEITMKQNDKPIYYKNDKDKIYASIIPNDDLKKTSSKLAGFNIFESGGKYGSDVAVEGFKNSKNGRVNVSYNIGATTKNSDIPLAPSDENLEELQQVARHGMLVLTRNNKEIGRYSLDTLNKVEQKPFYKQNK